MEAIPFEMGKIYERKRDIHSRFGGQPQGGISTPGNHPFIFLFTGESGERYGYKDEWTKDGMFRYTGEGQVGDMEFIRGNKAIRDHVENGKDLLLFEALGKGKGVRYKGIFSCASWRIATGPDLQGNQRKIILFEMVPHNTQSGPVTNSTFSLPLAILREKALAASRSVPQKSGRDARRSYYERSEDVRIYVLTRAAGKCEACKSPAPFARPDGSPYLEPHHTRRVSDGGPDDPHWVAGICPNCHKEIHYGVNGNELNRQLERYIHAIEDSLDAQQAHGRPE